MATDTARPAPRTFRPVTNDSEVLRADLARSGLGRRDLSRRSSRLVHDLRLAGALVPKKERREDLRLHLQYWAAVRRLLSTTPQETPDIEDYDPDFRELEHAESRFVPVSTSGAGLSQYEVRNISVSGGKAEWFIVEGCRLVEVRLRDLDVEYASLQESGLFLSHLLDAKADTIEAAFCGFISGTLSGQFGSADFSGSGMKNTDIMLTVPGLADFSGADCGQAANTHLEEQLRDVPHWPENKAAARFTSCRFATARFVDTKLDGATFRDCDFQQLDVTEANLRGASFVDCRVRGRPLTLADLPGAASTEDIHIPEEKTGDDH